MRTRDVTPLRCWILLLIAMLPLPAVWALANPLFASPDEPAHMVRAQGAIQGDFQRPYTTDGIPVAAVNCLMFRPETTADCIDLRWGPAGLQQPSTAETYPPLFHALAGIPALFLSGPSRAYAMRLWLALLSCALFAWAAVLLWTRRPDPWSMASLFLAATPMVVFTVATVNPSGLAAACAALVWAAGINVTRPTSGTLARASAWTLLLTLPLFALVRRDALAWELVLLTILAATTLRRARALDLVRGRAALAAIAVDATAMLVAWGAWAAPAMASFVAGRAHTSRGTWTSGMQALSRHLLELVGVFGWVDSPVGNETFLIAFTALAVVLAVGIAGGSQPEGRASLAALAALVIVPVVIGAIRQPYYFQGRYLFPAFIGAVLMAGQALGGGELPARLSRNLLGATVAAVALVQFLAFAQNLRRYAVGVTGTWLFAQNANWQPPMMSNRTALVLALAAILWALTVTRTLHRRLRITTENTEAAA